MYSRIENVRNRRESRCSTTSRPPRASGKEVITHIYDYTACKKWRHPREEPRKNSRLCSTVFWLSHDIYFAECLANPHESSRRRDGAKLVPRELVPASRSLVSSLNPLAGIEHFVVLDPHCPRTLHICTHGNDKYLHCP